MTTALILFLALSMAIAAGVVSAAIDLRRHLTESSARAERCARCGYDLHAVNHAQCPECGEIAN